MTAFRASISSVLALLWVAPLFSGCSNCGYFGQALSGHLSIVRRQHPIAALLDDPSTPAELRQSLQRVLILRDYASQQLALPVDGHYTCYADLDRRFVVWNVHAAPEFSLKARTWWYPWVGRLKYRGYFSEANALRLADQLSSRGQDAYVGGVEAYSTLGWFRDPVLNTFIHHSTGELAEILFHELAHQRVFVGGDTDFNEAFATAVAQEGTRRWLRETGRVEELDRYQRGLAQEREFVAVVQSARQKLDRIFETRAPHGIRKLPPEELGVLRAEKERVMTQLRQDHETLRLRWGGKSPYERWFARPINNAQLNTVATYYDLVPGFERLMQQEGGDLPRFYGAVKRLGRLGKEQRRIHLMEP